MSQIWNTLEYQLSSQPTKTWATHQGYPQFKSTLFDNISYIGMNVQTSSNVILMDVPVQNKNGILAPDLPLINSHFMIKGKSINGKRSIFISYKDFYANEAVIEMQNKMKDEISWLIISHFDKLKYQLLNKLSEAALDALCDGLQKMCDQGKVEELHEWFTEHNFTRIPSIEILKEMKNIGSIPGESKVGNFNHIQGRNILVDWEKKVFENHSYCTS